MPVDKKQGYLPYLSQKTEFVATTSAEKREITFFILIRFIILQRKMFNANKYQMMKTKEFPGRNNVQWALLPFLLKNLNEDGEKLFLQFN